MNCKNLIFSIWKKIDLKIFCECPSKKKIDKRDDNNKGTVHSLNSLPCFYPPNFASTNGNTTEKLWAAEERNYRHEKKKCFHKGTRRKGKIDIWLKYFKWNIYKKVLFVRFLSAFSLHNYTSSLPTFLQYRAHTQMHI